MAFQLNRLFGSDRTTLSNVGIPDAEPIRTGELHVAALIIGVHNYQ